MECQGKMPRAVTRKAESTDVHVCGGIVYCKDSNRRGDSEHTSFDLRFREKGG